MSQFSTDASNIAHGISVVIPSFNRPAETRAAVQSVCCQTTPPGEIIIVDDGSQAPLRQDELGPVSAAVRIIRHKRNLGAAAARQTGIDAAQGDYVAFLDSDDIWLPEKLEKQTPFLPSLDQPLVAVACGWWAVYGNSNRDRRERIPISSADPRDFASGCWFAPGSTTILPRRAFEIVGPFDPKLKRLEDLDWFLRFALAGGRLEVASIVGAQIAIGQRPTIKSVDASWRHFSEGIGRRLDPSCARRLKAYLLLERAAARRNAGNLPAMATFLFRSILAVPRFSLHLRRWWV